MCVVVLVELPFNNFDFQFPHINVFLSQITSLSQSLIWIPHLNEFLIFQVHVHLEISLFKRDAPLD